MDVTVVGAGVIGLTTAVTLQERGHRVRVVAAASGDAITSSVAGAVWFPYKVGPPGKVAVWAARTRTWLAELARTTPEAGVDILTGYEIVPDLTERPWWAGVPTMEGDELLAIDRVERRPAPVPGAPLAWEFTAPRAEPALFLAWLEKLLAHPIERRVVEDLRQERGDVVINCTGLAARDLVDDDLLIPLLGQVLVAEPGTADLATTVTDDRDAERIFYIIPRRDEVILGGCSIPFPPGDTPQISEELSERIVAQARALGIGVGAVKRTRVGLRPYRAEVRLEREGRILHNYGHGGAGFTLCRGCAEDVADLLNR
jgi:D-amino-acid oxidase